jgi:replicative DNA helicase
METQIVWGLLNSPRFYLTFRRHFKGTTWDRVPERVLKSFFKCAKAHNRQPSFESLWSFMVANPVPRESGNDRGSELFAEEVKAFMDDVKSTTVTDIDGLIENTKIYLEKRKTENAMMEILSVSDELGVDLDKAITLLQSCKVSVIEKETPTDLGNSKDLETFLSKLSEGHSVIPTGYPWLNKVMNGGWHNNTVNVFCSETNAGKTALLVSLSYQLSRIGKKGLFISYELDSHKISQRFCACSTSIPLQELSGQLSDQHRSKIQEYFSKHSGVSMHHLPDGSSTSDLKMSIDDYCSRGNQLDFLAVDYIGCLTSQNADSKASLYERYGCVISDLKQLADDYGVPVLTAHQVNRSGYDPKQVGMQSIGDSMKIAHKADNIFFLSKKSDSADGINRLVELKLDKSRVSGYNGATEMFTLNKNIQRFTEGNPLGIMLQDDENKERSTKALPDVGRIQV